MTARPPAPPLSPEEQTVVERFENAPDPYIGCDFCVYLPAHRKCKTETWHRPALPPVELVLRFWLAHGITPDVSGYHGHHAQALVDLLVPDGA